MRDHITSSQNERLKALGMMLCLLAIWIFTHPYLGIYHDGRLYAVQALHHLFPENYKNDLFFLYGSREDEFTIFGQIYSYGIKTFGLNNATVALLVTGLLLWFCSAFYMTRSVTKGPSFWASLLFLLALPSYYGSHVLAYGEPFLTPRLFSESLVLLSTGLLVRDQTFLPLLLLSAAVTIHPLISAAGFIAFFTYKSLDDKKWLAGPLLAVSLSMVAAALRVPPFTGLLEVMDRQWFTISNDRAEYLFVNNWSVRNFDAILFDASLIGSALLITIGKLRRLLAVSLTTGLGCLTLSWIGADVLHNVFFIQIQLWRSLWLMHLFANLSGAVLATKLWNDSKFSRLLLMGYLTAWFALELTSFAGILAAWIFLLHFYTSNISHKEIGIPGFVGKYSYLAPLIFGTYWSIYWFHDAYFASLVNHDGKTLYDLVQEFLRTTRVIPVLAFVLLWKLVNRIDRKPVLVSLISGFLCLNALLVYQWDKGQAREKLMYNETRCSRPPFQDKIPIGSVVCWPDYDGESSINKIWFLLKRSSYADVVQGAGIFYSRNKAMKYAARSNSLKSLNIFSDKRFYQPSDKILPKPAFTDLVNVCQDPELNFVVLNFKYSNKEVASYYDAYEKKKYYLYNCELIRNN